MYLTDLGQNFSLFAMHHTQQAHTLNLCPRNRRERGVQGVRGECADECAGDLAEATLEFNGGVGLGCRDSLCKSMGIRAELKHVIARTKPT